MRQINEIREVIAAGLFNSCESHINEVISPGRYLWSISITINIEWGDIMDIVGDKCPPLMDILSEIPDYRKAKVQYQLIDINIRL